MPDSDAWLIPGSRREAALERIYAAGSDVLRERGPKKFSLEEVARRAGCSRATVYRFVGNKRSLVDTLVGLAVLGRDVSDGLGLVNEENLPA
ncbi:TetR/AcrR family transcriptional regulator [Nocardioides kribbensis]|uniref:TetR/AcrR family transcriptional regulator n=1 Tax=Nocardioides kribbensis TaxID=305517 RepID=UPI003D81BE01